MQKVCRDESLLQSLACATPLSLQLLFMQARLLASCLTKTLPVWLWMLGWHRFNLLWFFLLGTSTALDTLGSQSYGGLLKRASRAFHAGSRGVCRDTCSMRGSPTTCWVRTSPHLTCYHVSLPVSTVTSHVHFPSCHSLAGVPARHARSVFACWEHISQGINHPPCPAKCVDCRRC